MAAKKPMAEISSVGDLIDQVKVSLAFNSGLICFRGQRNESWATQAGILRPERANLLKNEKKAVRDIVSTQPNEFAADQTMFDRLVRMQHYGLPTRLIDVTRNPLVALYFASEPDPSGVEVSGRITIFDVDESRQKYFDSDAVSCLANLANMTPSEKVELGRLATFEKEKFNNEEIVLRLVQFIKEEKPYFLNIIEPEDLFKPYYVTPKLNNKRIIAQAGAFMIVGLDARGALSYKRNIVRDFITVGADAKVSIREELAMLGIEEANLFPEIEKAAGQIIRRYA